MKNTSQLDMNLLEEMTQLEYFLVKKPISSPEFWVEWQEKYGKATLARIALRKISRTKRLSHEDYSKLRTLMGMYEDVLRYLESLKNIALNLRGMPGNMGVELDDDDMDLEL
ncbi:MAG TPA: hypothetical protein EYP11_01050 [Aquificaceae bacterium]|nr:hypothetical protein [Aquificaceae bacterium]